MKQGLGFDESVLESLEEALVAADVGAETAAALADAVRAPAGGSDRKDLAALRSDPTSRRSRSSWPPPPRSSSAP